MAEFTEEQIIAGGRWLKQKMAEGKTMAGVALDLKLYIDAATSERDRLAAEVARLEGELGEAIPWLRNAYISEGDSCGGGPEGFDENCIECQIIQWLSRNEAKP